MSLLSGARRQESTVQLPHARAGQEKTLQLSPNLLLSRGRETPPTAQTAPIPLPARRRLEVGFVLGVPAASEWLPSMGSKPRRHDTVATVTSCRRRVRLILASVPFGYRSPEHRRPTLLSESCWWGKQPNRLICDRGFVAVPIHRPPEAARQISRIRSQERLLAAFPT